MSEEQQNYQEQEQKYQEDAQPQKVYAPANPTMKDCISLIQLLPVNEMDKNIDAIAEVIYENDDLHNEFLQKVDNRTTVSKDDPKGEFICCEHNRDGDSYRSPCSNQYFPPATDCSFPSKELRLVEEKLNKMFQIYTKHYYSPVAQCSVYCWSLGQAIKEGFGVAVLIKNAISHQSGISDAGWDSNNVVNVKFSEKNGKLHADYNLISTISVKMAFTNKICGKVDLSGNISRNAHVSKMITQGHYDDAHIETIGVLIEDLETSIRNSIENIYVMKSKEIIDTARTNPTMGKPGIKQSEKLKEAFMSGQK